MKPQPNSLLDVKCYCCIKARTNLGRTAFDRVLRLFVGGAPGRKVPSDPIA